MVLAFIIDFRKAKRNETTLSSLPGRTALQTFKREIVNNFADFAFK